MIAARRKRTLRTLRSGEIAALLRRPMIAPFALPWRAPFVMSETWFVNAGSRSRVSRRKLTEPKRLE